MDANTYQEISLDTWSGDDDADVQILHAALGLAGEAGEVVDYVKKHSFNYHRLPEEPIIGELGDTLYYLAMLCTLFGYTLSEVMQHNIDKLSARYGRNDA